MAVTKQDVLSFIGEHITSDRSKIPAKDIIAALGSDAKAVIDQLKKDGVLKGNRGRNGGLTVAGEASEQEAAPSEDVASQFAALMEKMEADMENGSASSELEAAVG